MFTILDQDYLDYEEEFNEDLLAGVSSTDLEYFHFTIDEV